MFVREEELRAKHQKGTFPDNKRIHVYLGEMSIRFQAIRRTNDKSSLRGAFGSDLA